MSEFGALFPAEFHQFNDKYAHHVLDARHSASATVAASTPTITTLSGSDFLHKLSATILGSLQLQPSRHADSLSSAAASLGAGAASTVATATGAGLPRTTTATATLRSLASNMDFDLTPNRVLVDSSSFSSMDEMQKQLEYDKFMNEIWIGIVLTLIVISLVFCVCSCFLYHQFRTWKRNYNATVVEAQAVDVEAVKLNPDREDPVPEYTLVSGLPSYEAALELLHKAPSTCVLVYPSVFSVFNRREEKSAPSNNNNNNMDTTNMQQQQLSAANESPSTPLMAATTRCEPTSVKAMRREVPSYAEATATARAPAAVTVPSTTAAAAAARVISLTCVNEKSSAGKKPSSDRTATTTTNSTTSRTYEKVPTYDDALVIKSLDSKPSS